MSASRKTTHVVVVGAGVIGVTTAYYLAQSGLRVTIVDRADDVANGASHANGGQLSYSFTDALAKPEFVAKIPGLLAGRDIGSRMRLAPRLIPWGLRFLSQCTSKRARQNTLAALQMTMRSAQLLNELRARLPFEFAHRPAGKLVLLSSDEDLRAATRSSSAKNEYGCETQILDAGDAIRLEPALDRLSESFVGAVYSQDDEVADARLFTTHLSEWLIDNADVRFRMNTAIAEMKTTANGIVAVCESGEEIAADKAIICTGAWSGELLRPLGINPHIYPVRGYSVTLPPGKSAPNVSITALKQRIVFSRINGSIRVAGFADFTGFSTRADGERIAALMEVASRYAPEAADYAADEQHGWGGFRPMTPNGQPCIGRTSVDNLFLNTGHGMLGWTLALASGHDIAQTVNESLR